jgi:NAD(P)-dependent dehydrogenase (short-subunit alcohol dehydrogenase family)
MGGRFEGQVAVVTGGARGIGDAIARQLVADGARVVVADLLAPSDPIPGVRYVACDITDRAAVETAHASIEAIEGRLDVLVNNAGILYDTWQHPSDADLGQVREALEVNLLGAWRTAQALLPLMRGGGRIVNVSSGAGSLTGMSPGTPAYGVSKAALNAFTIKLAGELRARGILVNAVCPGWVATDMGGVGGRPVEQGAASVLWAVDLPDDGPTGGFFRDGRAIDW